jgi:hypothetical protein
VFENRMLRRIFEPKMDKVMENWRKLHNEKHSSQNIIRVIKLRRVT